MQKNIITRIGETIDSFYAEKQTEIPAGQRPTRSNFSRILQWLLPNGGTIIIVLALFLTQTVWARSYQGILNPSNSTGTIAYQGRLADSSGVPLTSTYPMVFRLYNTASGGAPLWEEQWTASNSVAVSDGLFNVMLGSITPVPQNILSSNTSLWLGISVGSDSEMTPRVQLGSVPYAFQALTVPDGAITGAKLADGSVSQIKLGPDVSLVPPDGSITTAKIADGAISKSKVNFSDAIFYRPNLPISGCNDLIANLQAQGFKHCIAISPGIGGTNWFESSSCSGTPKYEPTYWQKNEIYDVQNIYKSVSSTYVKPDFPDAMPIMVCTTNP